MRIKEWFIRREVIKWTIGALLVGFLLGMAVGVSADPGTTRNYATQTISFFFDIDEIMVLPECPAGWMFEAYVQVADPDRYPALMPVLVAEGECVNAN